MPAGGAEKIIEHVLELEKLDDIGTLTRLLRADR